MRVLILGGTSESSALARTLAGDRRFDVVLSLAGRTTLPAMQPVPVRIGGFGGVPGLERYLAEQHIAAAIDATHPYADQISRHAVTACRACRVPLFSVARAPWRQGPGDRWIVVGDAAAAAEALGTAPARVFLTLGRLELAAFAAAPQHDYIARTIDPPGDITLPPKIRFLAARGPFDAEAERALMAAHGIEIVVSKNSGGDMTSGKIAAARALGLPVVMIERPVKPVGEQYGTVAEALAWLEMEHVRHGTSSGAPPVSRRGV